MTPRTTTSRRTVVGAAALTATALTLGACGAVGVPGERVSQERDVAGTTAVRLRTVGDLSVTTGAEPALTVTAGDRVIDRITTEVRDGELVIDLPGRWANIGRLDYDLVVPGLTAVRVDGAGDVDAELAPDERLELEIGGAGDVRVQGVDVEVLVASVDGAGSIHVEGSADRQEVSIDGAGTFEARDLRSRTAQVEVAGVGSARVDVTETLDAAILGAGSISYLGDPDVTSRLEGVGRITQD